MTKLIAFWDIELFVNCPHCEAEIYYRLDKNDRTDNIEES